MLLNWIQEELFSNNPTQIEGASRAFAGLFSASEQFMFEGGSGSSGSASVHSDILARHTSSVAAQLTQQYLNSMLIT